MTSRIASKDSLRNMKITPIALKLISPYEAIAVPTAIATTEEIKFLLGVSRFATKSAIMVMMGVNACNACTDQLNLGCSLTLQAGLETLYRRIQSTINATLQLHS